MNEPTIEAEQFLSVASTFSDEHRDAAIKGELVRLYGIVKSLDAQPVPVEPDVEALVETLRGFGRAYPEDIFGPVTQEEQMQHGNLITRNSAAMGRHCAQFMVKAADMIDSLRSALQRAQEELHIVFDGPPSHESGRFVECETADGKSVNVGRWEQRGEYWHLILGGKK